MGRGMHIGRSLHPSYGPVPKEMIAEALAAPSGKATQILRKYDPLFGRGVHNPKKFSITVTRKAIRKDEAIVEIEAADEKQAEEILDAMDWDDFNWREGFDDDYEDHSVEETKLIKGAP